MADFSALPKDMDKLSERAVKSANRYLRATALEVHRQLVLLTPFDTGAARTNWQVSTSGFGSEIIKKDDYDKSGSAAISSAKAVLNGSDAGEVFIFNNLPYVEALNNGSSAQRAAGFIESGIQVGVLKISSAAARGIL